MSAREVYLERDTARRARVAERAKARRVADREARYANKSFNKLLREKN